MSRATEKSTTIVMTEAGKVQMDLFEKEWPNVQALVECPKPECCAVGSFTKAGTARCRHTIKCSKCHKRVTGEQVTKLLEQYAPEPEDQATPRAAENQESESLASLVKCLLREVSWMKETIGALRHENTAMKAEIRRLRIPVGISPHTSTATAEVNVTEEPNEDFPALRAAVQAPINGPATFAMAVKRNLPVTKLNYSDKSKLTTLRGQVRS